MKIWINTNGRPSESAELLAKQKDFGRAKLGGAIKEDDIVINWGSAAPLQLLKNPKRVLNNFEAVLSASNKLKAFERFSENEIPVPRWTNDKVRAAEWEHTLFARTKLSGHSGDGIIVVAKGEEVPDAPLYTYYIFKEREYRVHVVGDQVVDTQRKVRDMDREVKSWKIRSHDNGFMFIRNNVLVDKTRDEIAVKACNALKLDFGAVDIIQDPEGNYYVLEINTAPGLEGQTVQNYATAFREIAGINAEVLH